MSRRAWERRAIARGSEAQLLPRATIPREAETILPAGPDRLLAATQLARVELAPADARGYRVGIQQGQRLMRWFPQARFTIAVRPVDRRLRLTDGDRTYKPRVAGSRSARPGRAVTQGGAQGLSAGEALSILVGAAMRHLYPPPREPLHRLCYEVSPRYIERGDLVDRISDSFERHPSRPVLLCGASGCGTTQVALRYAQKYEKDYRVMWLIDCADGITARRDLAELAKALSLPFYNCLRARPDLGHGTAEALR